MVDKRGRNGVRDRSRERAREDYVKAIYHLSGQAPVRAADLARYLEVSRASVSKSRRVLESAGFVRASKGRVDALRLTPKGFDLAVSMVRRNRLVETFLHRKLNVPLERVHADAERIEHTISDDIAQRLAAFLGNPRSDPHGHPIPAVHSTGIAASAMRLSQVDRGDRVVITALDDRDEASVKYLSARGILPGLRVTVDAVARNGLQLRAGRKRFTISKRAAQGVRCTLVERGYRDG
jgi:DtxR family transcriptional regulator, Mn-dependent transcriptional regulator